MAFERDLVRGGPKSAQVFDTQSAATSGLVTATWKSLGLPLGGRFTADLEELLAMITDRLNQVASC